MFNKRKINYTNGKTRTILWGRTPLFEYGVYKNKKFFRIFLFGKILYLSKKHKIYKESEQPVFYLKINTYDSEESRKCVEYWLQVAECMDAYVIVLCDKKNIISKLQDRINYRFPLFRIINSQRNYFKKFVHKLQLDTWWYNAAYAHLTTFKDAIDFNISNFWNIDADDTLCMVEPIKMANYMTLIRKYAIDNDISLFSLDMHFSNSHSQHWTYGVTYTSNPNKILDYFIKDSHIKDWHKFRNVNKYCKSPVLNIDWFTTFIKSKNEIKIDSFYIDNIYFLHCSQPLLTSTLSLSSFADNKIEYPIFKNVYGINQTMISEIPISKQCIKFEFNDIDLTSSKRFMLDYFVQIKEKIKISEFFSSQETIH